MQHASVPLACFRSSIAIGGADGFFGRASLDGKDEFTNARWADELQRVALPAILGAAVTLSGCTAADPLASLPAPIKGTVIEKASPLLAEGPPVQNTTIPVHTSLAPKPDRPGIGFRVLPHSRDASSILIAWVNNGDDACGEADDIWAHETRMQVVITVYAPPTLSGAHPTDCTDQGIIHIQAIRLQAALGDRTINAFSGTPAIGDRPPDPQRQTAWAGNQVSETSRKVRPVFRASASPRSTFPKPQRAPRSNPQFRGCRTR